MSLLWTFSNSSYEYSTQLDLTEFFNRLNYVQFLHMYLNIQNNFQLFSVLQILLVIAVSLHWLTLIFLGIYYEIDKFFDSGLQWLNGSVGLNTGVKTPKHVIQKV